MKKKIYIIDDEPDLVDILDELLVNEGYEVRKAYTGVEGIRLLKNGIPHLIILDVMMPQMDGLEVLRRLRSYHKTFSIPIIMLTAKGGTESILEAQRFQVSDYLTKPFDTMILLETIRKHVS